jgi:uncharacterized protein YoxC
MENIQTILLIILSIGFAILLIIAIAVGFLIVKILSNIRRITQRVDETSENLGEMTKYMGQKVGPAAAAALWSLVWRRTKSSIRRKK